MLSPKFSSQETRRYGRQMLLPTIASEGQRNLLDSKVLVIGAGGIGSSAALYLASAGVPITILDHDLVEESNLHRQIIHDAERIQTPKAESAVARLKAINPTLNYQAITTKLTAENAYDILRNFDLVLDCTDNFDARFVINDACVMLRIPYISGSAVGLEGQITVVIPGKTPCYRCLYPNPSVAEACRSCANAGVLGPVPGLIGCLEATEAIKLLLKGVHKDTTSSSSHTHASPAAINNLDLLTGRQVFYDAAQGEFFTFDLPPRNVECTVCGDNPSITSLEHTKAFLDHFQQRTECAVNDYLGDIPSEHRLSIEDFQRMIAAHQSQTSNTSPASSLLVILDVRSTIQYGIANLSHMPTITSSFSTIEQFLTTWEPSSSPQVALVNVPLAELQSPMHQHSKSLLAKLFSSSSPLEVPSVHLTMLCRRGVDSTVATRHLLQVVAQEMNEPGGAFTHLIASKIKIWNVEGGLTAWHRDIDPSFPMY